MNEAPLRACENWLRRCATLRWQGRVQQVLGNLIESAGPFCSVGESCEIVCGRGTPTRER